MVINGFVAFMGEQIETWKKTLNERKTKTIKISLWFEGKESFLKWYHVQLINEDMNIVTFIMVFSIKNFKNLISPICIANSLVTFY